MKAKLALLALLVPAATATTAPSSQPGSHPALPWLVNLQDVVAADANDPLQTFPIERSGDPASDPGLEPADPMCRDDASQGLVLSADVSPAPGSETLLASFSQGVTVLGSEGQELASTPGYPCFGSADQVDVLAAGTAFGTPTVVLAVTVGGRREQATWLAMFRIGTAGRLEPVFTTVVEEREDEIVRRGSVTVLRDGLLVRHPSGRTAVWRWDAAAGVYLPPVARDELAGDHGQS
ncbi:MAG: hypothetical protein JWP01_105 [Myxococcales bacterium]|nr:hypothetical protein [Myxococcales bacterium]